MTTVQLPEPDFRLIDYAYGLMPNDDEYAEWHDQWHMDHPERQCENPDQPRKATRPGALERFRRWIR